jgi:LuxR family quorum-sensing system transcriptional regulator CciR
MPFARLIDRFAERAATCSSDGELRELIAAAAGELGFRFFALLHHSSLRQSGPNLIRLDNYPAGWEEELRANDLLADDPVHIASGRSNAGFAWEELGALLPLTRRHRDILERSGRFGIGSGFTVPANVPGEPVGSCSFAVRRGCDLPAARLLCAEQIGAHAFRAARRLHGFPRTGRRPRLSRRELQCLHLVAAGKGDWEIATILGISHETARQYVKRARAAYDVVSRTQLVVQGLRDAWIGFDDAIPPDGGLG